LPNEDSTVHTAYTRMFVSKVVVSNTQIVISGPTSALEAGLAKGNPKPNGMVPSFDQQWCRLRDSNT
jgi:site-specific DNA recombinase